MRTKMSLIFNFDKLRFLVSIIHPPSSCAKWGFVSNFLTFVEDIRFIFLNFSDQAILLNQERARIVYCLHGDNLLCVKYIVFRWKFLFEKLNIFNWLLIYLSERFVTFLIQFSIDIKCKSEEPLLNGPTHKIHIIWWVCWISLNFGVAVTRLGL